MAVDIIVKKFSNIFNICGNGVILTGDVSQDMATVTFKEIERIIDKHSKKDTYYIMVYARPKIEDNRQIMNKIIISNRKPPKLIGTMCFEINNRSSTVEKLWILPLDKMRPEASILTDEKIPSIIEDSKDVKTKF